MPRSGACARWGKPVIAVDAEALARLAPDLLITQGLCEVCAVADGEIHRLAALLHPAPAVLSLWPAPAGNLGGHSSRRTGARSEGRSRGAGRGVERSDEQPGRVAEHSRLYASSGSNRCSLQGTGSPSSSRPPAGLTSAQRPAAIRRSRSGPRSQHSSPISSSSCSAASTSPALGRSSRRWSRPARSGSSPAHPCGSSTGTPTRRGRDLEWWTARSG